MLVSAKHGIEDTERGRGVGGDFFLFFIVFFLHESGQLRCNFEF